MIARGAVAVAALGLVLVAGQRVAAAAASEDLAKLLGVDSEAPPPGAPPAATAPVPPAAAAAVAPPPAAVTPRDLHARVAPAVVGLVVGGGAAGTAPTIVPAVMVTASGLALTSRTAIAGALGDAGAASLAVVRLGGRAVRPSARDFADAVPARVIALSEELDLALVEALPRQSVFYRHLPVARGAAPAGTAVLAAGHAAGRGLWAGSVAVLGAPPAPSGAGPARWLRALASGGADITPGTPLVDAVGRVVGLAVSAPPSPPHLEAARAGAGGGAGALMVADAEGLWRFLIAAGAPERRFAGVSPMRRPPPVGASLGGRTVRAAAPPSAGPVAGAAPAVVAAGAPAKAPASSPDAGFAVAVAVVDKGTLDKGPGLVAASAPGAGRAPVAAAAVGPAKVDKVTFDEVVPAARLTIADLERHARPATVRLSLQGAPERGAVKAPVTVVQLGDYLAPDTREAERAVRELCGDARVRYLWKDADRGDADQRLYARAALAAGEQGKFWPMHDRLLQSPRPPRAAEIRRFAHGLGINDEAFAVAAGDGTDGTQGAIDGALQEEGRVAGTIPVLATPSFVVNGKPVDGGSIAGAALRAAIDEELAAPHLSHSTPPAASPSPSAPQAGAEAQPARIPPTLATGPAIAGTPFDAGQASRATAAALAYRAKAAGSRVARR